MCLSLPKDTVKNFSTMCDMLDRDKEHLEIETYGLQVTSMEDVFLKVAANYNKNDMEIPIIPEQGKIESGRIATPRISAGPMLFLRQLLALLIKRFKISTREFTSLFFEIIFPISIIVLGCAIFKQIMSTKEPADSYQFHPD